MDALKTVMKSIVKGLQSITKEAQKLEKVIDNFEKSQPEKKREEAPARASRAGRIPKKRASKEETATDIVFGLIKRSRKGVDAVTLKKKTGFEGRKVYDIINRLKRQGKIKSGGRGIYIKA